MPHHPDIARALGRVRPVVERAGLPGKALLVACSGGRDSVALLGLLHCLRGALRLELAVGHVDHGLRPESPAERAQVGALAGRLGLPFEARRLALQPGGNLADRARLARRGALEQMAAQRGSAAIALGHTATDQAETVLMNLTRGAGLIGLCGMREHEGAWVRPILALTRQQTAALCGHLGLGFVDDPTNELEDTARIRIRSKVLPLLEDQNPRAVRAISGAAWRLQGAADEIERAAAAAYHQVETPSGLRLDAIDLCTLSRAVLGRLVRRALTVHGVGEVSAQTMEAIESALLEQARARVGEGPPGGARPRTFEVRPSKRVAVDRAGLSVSTHAVDAGSNH